MPRQKTMRISRQGLSLNVTNYLLIANGMADAIQIKRHKQKDIYNIVIIETMSILQPHT